MSGVIPLAGSTASVGLDAQPSETVPDAAKTVSSPTMSHVGTLVHDIAQAVESPSAQTAEADLIAGLPRLVRGLVYSIGGGVSAVATSVVSWDMSNPGVLPGWLTATAAIVAPIAAATTGGVAWANLGKK